MKNELKDKIDRNTAGLDDIMLKKMVLTNNACTYMEKMTILMELADEEIYKLDENGNKIMKTSTELDEMARPYSIEIGSEILGLSEMYEHKDKEEGTANADKMKNTYFLMTNGLVQMSIKKLDEDGNAIKDENGKDKYEKLIYYPQDTLETIYENEYKEALKTNTKSSIEYAKNAWEYLKTTYTIDENNNVAKYVSEKVTTSIKWKQDNNSRERVEYNEVDETELRTIDYQTYIKDLVIPIELMTSLLEIVESKEFVNEFMAVVKDQMRIELEILIKNTIETETERFDNATVRSGLNYVGIYSAYKGTDKLAEGVNTSIYGSPEFIKKTVNTDGKITVQLTGSAKEACDVTLYRGSVLLETVNLNEENNYSHTWTGLSPENVSITDDGKLLMEKITKSQIEEPLIILKDIQNWYMKLSQGYDVMTIKINGKDLLKQGTDEAVDGEEIGIENPASGNFGVGVGFVPADREKMYNSAMGNMDVWTKDMKEEEKNKVSALNEDEFWNGIYLYLNSKTDDTGNTTSSSLETMGYTKTGLTINFYQEATDGNGHTIYHDFASPSPNNIADKNYKIKDREYYWYKPRIATPEDDSKVFLSLLRDGSGNKKKYKHIYGEEIVAGDMLVNGLGILKDLIKENGNLGEAMEVIAYKYSNGITGVVEWDFKEFKEEEFKDVAA